MKLKYHFNFTQRSKLYLRVILTDICNNNCVYCFREANVGGNCGKLTDSFFNELIQVAEKYNIPKIHFTGGEPLLENKIIHFIKKIKSQSALDVGLTTNGTLLKLFAANLYKAGLKRINVSIPTLDSLKYSSICKQDTLPEVLQNVDNLILLGYNPIKINIPLFKQNVDEINHFLTYFLEKDNIILRFFSVLPNPGLNSNECLTNEETINTLEKQILLLPLALRKEAIKRVFYRRPTQAKLKMCTNCPSKTICQDQAKAIRVTKDGTLSLCLLNTKYSVKAISSDQIDNSVQKLLDVFN